MEHWNYGDQQKITTTFLHSSAITNLKLKYGAFHGPGQVKFAYCMVMIVSTNRSAYLYPVL